ncbi:MAG: sigma-70 family RNA polymerase sigma factor [Phycisphaeraceae bacterium]|nr:sigma-70 family RNA polymerase sigma factor [Phycisphaeraceae bacterium]
MPRLRQTNPSTSRNSPLDRVRARSRSSVGPVSGTHKPASDATRIGRRKSRGSGEELRRLSRREESLLARVLEKEIDYINADIFHEADAETEIFGLDDVERPDVTWYRPLMEDLIPARGRVDPPKAGKSLVLSGAQERILFLKFNYARFRMRAVQIEIGTRRPDLGEARTILRWHAIAASFREQIAETNLALVLAMAKRVRIMDGEFADVVSEGNMALMRSVDKFDCERGFKFSTYACRAILKAFSRHGMKSTRHRQRFVTDFDPAFERSDHLETRRAEYIADSAAEVRHLMDTNEAELTSVEQTVIGHRFGVGVEEARTTLTLEQVGQIIGVTKERVRQIQNKALEKLRTTIEDLNPAEARIPSTKN